MSGLWPIRRTVTSSRSALDQYILGVEHLLQADLKVRVEGFMKEYNDYPASMDRPYLVLANTGGGYRGIG